MSGLELSVGDRVIVNLPIYRKPWQFWRPRIVGHKRWSLALTEARLKSLHDEEMRFLEHLDLLRDARAFADASMRGMNELLGLTPRDSDTRPKAGDAKLGSTRE